MLFLVAKSNITECTLYIWFNYENIDSIIWQRQNYFNKKLRKNLACWNFVYKSSIQCVLVKKGSNMIFRRNFQRLYSKGNYYLQSSHLWWDYKILYGHETNRVIPMLQVNMETKDFNITFRHMELCNSHCDTKGSRKTLRVWVCNRRNKLESHVSQSLKSHGSCAASESLYCSATYRHKAYRKIFRARPP